LVQSHRLRHGDTRRHGDHLAQFDGRQALHALPSGHCRRKDDDPDQSHGCDLRMKHLNSTIRRRSAAFTLVEVMVALIVLSIGLLGIASMQAMALSSTTNARMRSLAAIEAASLASVMHTNRAYWATSAPATFTVKDGVISDTVLKKSGVDCTSTTTPC